VTDKPTRNEDEFFAREEAEKLHRLHVDKVRALSAAEIEAQKKTHFMKCGKCGYDLQTIRWRNVDVEKCFRCGAILLDEGELEKLAGKEESGQFVSSFIGLFKKP
jgi:ribosomal protein S27E